MLRLWKPEGVALRWLESGRVSSGVRLVVNLLILFEKYHLDVYGLLLFQHPLHSYLSHARNIAHGTTPHQLKWVITQRESVAQTIPPMWVRRGSLRIPLSYKKRSPH